MSGAGSWVYPAVVTAESLKLEAIKWVKELEKYEVPVKISKNVTIIRKNQAHGDIEGYHIRAWIMHFFNLTEEDLK